MTQVIVLVRPKCEIERPGRAPPMLGGIRARLHIWSARRRARTALLSISDAELKELGISRAQALFEYNKAS